MIAVPGGIGLKLLTRLELSPSRIFTLKHSRTKEITYRASLTLPAAVTLSRHDLPEKMDVAHRPRRL
jgi:hypothetical protein